MECIGICIRKCNEIEASNLQDFGWTPQNNQALRLVMEQRTKELNDAINAFKLVVNKNVTKPISYSNDEDFCKLGPWVEDNAYKKETNTNINYYSGRHDLSLVAKTTMDFVNAHGGWNTNGDKETVYVIIEKN